MNVEAYKANAVKFGRLHGQALAGLSGDMALVATYYDAAHVFQQIEHETGYQMAVEAALKVYRDYALLNDGALPGYWSFTDGLTTDAMNGNQDSKRAVVLISKNAAYHQDVVQPEATAHASMSREVAYAMLAMMNAERLGEPRRERLNLLFVQAIDHLDQWAGRKSMTYVQPFMVGITAAALARYHDQIEKDKRIVPALKQTADWLWSTAWRSAEQAFYYESTNAAKGAPDLNMLVLPLFAFVFRETGKGLERAEQIFNGGVAGAWLEGAKQFNQSYLRGFKALSWLDEKPALRRRIAELEGKLKRVKEAVE